MEWKDISINPLLVKNYSLLSEIGIFDYIEHIKIVNKELEELIIEAYNISTKKSIDELVAYLTECLSEKFIPSDLVIILNEEIMNNKLKTIAFKNLKSISLDMKIETLEPFESFFRKHSGSISYYLFESEINNSELLSGFKDINAEIIIPIIGHSGLYGLIVFGPKILGEDYTNEEIEYIDRLMKFISVGIQNNIHYEHSVKDSKTGMYNHNFFIRRCNEELARSKRNKEFFSLIIMDIDNFKNFNDNFGHLAGDEVIIAIANSLKHELREGDILSRFGGEEFTVLLPETNSSLAMNVAERIRNSIECLCIHYENKKFKVTISVGVSVYNWNTDYDVNYLLNRADEALYDSKEAGRNRVTLFKSGLLHRANSLQNKKV